MLISFKFFEFWMVILLSIQLLFLSNVLNISVFLLIQSIFPGRSILPAIEMKENFDMFVSYVSQVHLLHI